ncbi:MAG: COX15/CtaA family protein [Wolbachia endosymbiont of Tyrophagus putrescentiae]|nr:COX15/CtaA family protein [Wolbachia endosymbiont of Tyrophagus putrescentiae]
MEAKQSKSVIIWLLLCCIMVLLMVGIGGFTRLTRAGLSITEWKPITGILPPLNKQDWIEEKSKYEATPEYRAFNYGISMEEFRVIYLTEYIHRLVARLTGLVFVLPLAYFAYKKKISKKVTVKLFVVLLLGVLQAFAGWYMVKSGLDTEPHVSHYRLAFHLLLALMIFSLLLSQLFANLQQKKLRVNVNTTYIKVILILTVAQIIFGAFVAGLNAGLIYNTFPLMEGRVVPSDLFFLQPVWLNFFENRTTVQFIHRLLALLILILTVIKHKSLRFILLLVATQVILGIATLLLQVPTIIAVAHQIFAFILFAAYLYLLHIAKQQTSS